MKQTSRNDDKLNHAPDKAPVALLLIDVVNDLEFDGGENLLPHALRWLTRWRLSSIASKRMASR